MSEKLTEAKMLSVERLRELFSYDRDTGVVAKKAPAQRKPPAVRHNDYVKVSADGKTYLAHRIAWALATGEWPAGEIDHINGIRSDNRLANLRDVPRQINCHNRHAVRAASGILGVSFKANKWEAKIAVNRRQIHLGRFQTKEEARAAYLAAKRIHHAEGCAP